MYSNVIAPGPCDWKAAYPELEAAANVLANRSEEAVGRINALSTMNEGLGAKHESKLPASVALPLFATRSHEALLRMLAGHAEGLRDGHYKGTNGPSSHCVVGARGIGKTNFMRAFTAVCTAAYPSIIPLYVTGEGLERSDSSFRELALEELILAAAAQHGLVAECLEYLVEPLRRAGKQMLIIVDEAEQLYRVSADEPALRRTVGESLGALDFLGNTISGVFGTLVCGSAAAMPLLITGKGATVLGDTFPLLRDGVPDLNITKYSKRVIMAADCKDTKQVGLILNHTSSSPFMHDYDRAKLINGVAFLAGTVPRTIAGALNLRRQHSSQAQVSPGLLEQLFGPPPALSVDARALYARIYQLLQQENRELIAKSVDKSGALVRDFVEGDEWAADDRPASLRPITRAQAAKAWQRLAPESTDPRARHDLYFQSLLDSLSDGNLIAQRHLDETGETIWPMSAAQLVLMGKEDPFTFKALPSFAWELLQVCANLATVVGALGCAR